MTERICFKCCKRFNTEDPHVELCSSCEKTDQVNHPRHYSFSIEVIDAIESWGLGYHLGNVVKYVARAAHKVDVLTDLRKARWYLDREIAREAAKGVKLSSEECELMGHTGLAYLAGSDVAEAGGDGDE